MNAQTVATPVGPREIGPTILRAFDISNDWVGMPLQEVVAGGQPPAPRFFANRVVNPDAFSEYVLTNHGWEYVEDIPFVGTLTD